MCALLGVTRAGYYAWRRRPLSTRTEQDRALTQQITTIFKASGGTYGAPRLYEALRQSGTHTSRRRVSRLMRAVGLRARSARIYRSNPGVHDFYAQHPNRVWKRRARHPDRIWVADITYLPIVGRWRYLAVVIDQCSRRVVGWSLAAHRGTDLTRAAFHQALRLRRPPKGLIFHSDRGSEYGGRRFVRRLKRLGLRQSMGRPGTPGDNAHAESFFHSLKADVIHGVQFSDERQLRRCLTTYIAYYNRHRLHSSLGYRSPVEYESDVA